MLILLEAGNRIVYETIVSTTRRFREGDPSSE
jgi:hypothetical protein